MAAERLSTGVSRTFSASSTYLYRGGVWMSELHESRRETVESERVCVCVEKLAYRTCRSCEGEALRTCAQGQDVSRAEVNSGVWW